MVTFVIMMTQDDFDELMKNFQDLEPDMVVRKLTPTEVSHKRKMAGGLIESMGDELYRLPGGSITGKGGLQMFNEAVARAGKQYIMEIPGKEKFGENKED